MATSSNVGGKAGAAAAKVLQSTEPTSSTSTPFGDTKNGSASGEEPVRGSGDGGTGGEVQKSTKTDELVKEATQLLKSLRVQPKISVMRISELGQGQQELALVDSGATHALRPARDWDEWNKAETTTVMLAEGSTTRFRLKHGTKLLLSEPGQRQAWIVPMGGLAELDFTLQWTGDQCLMKDDEGRRIDVQVQHGCPMVSLEDAERILEWWKPITSISVAN